MMRINVMLSEDIIEQLDEISRAEKKNRSELLREAALRLIEDYRQMIAEEKRRERIKKAITLQDTIRKKSGKWNGMKELRKWRETAR